MKRVNKNKPINSSMTFSIEEVLGFLMIIPQLENCNIYATEYTNGDLDIVIDSDVFFFYRDGIPKDNKGSTVKKDYFYEEIY